MATFLKEDIFLYAALVNIDAKFPIKMPSMFFYLRSLILVDFDCLVFVCRKIESLIEQFGKKPTCFFILTNSRSLASDKVKSLSREAQYVKIVLLPEEKEIFLESKLSLGVSLIKLPFLSRNGPSYRLVP